MSIRTMQIELEQWGQWARAEEGGLPPYQSPAYSLLRQHMQQANAGVPIVLNEDALIAIDYLVTQLRLSKPVHHQILSAHYLHGYSVRQLAALIPNTSRRAVEHYLIAAESWLDSRLEILCEMA